MFQHMSDLFSHNLNYRKGAFSLFWLVTKTQNHIYIYIFTFIYTCKYYAKNPIQLAVFRDFCHDGETSVRRWQIHLGPGLSFGSCGGGSGVGSDRGSRLQSEDP